MNPDDKTPEPRTMPIRFDPRMSGQARNSPCSCGSGKKAKRCCIDPAFARRVPHGLDKPRGRLHRSTQRGEGVSLIDPHRGTESPFTGEAAQRVMTRAQDDAAARSILKGMWLGARHTEARQVRHAIERLMAEAEWRRGR
jgi:hypothetical protein